MSINNPEMAMLNEIAVKVGKMEATQEAQTKDLNRLTNNIDRLIDKLDESDDLARDALKSASSAHKRLDLHEKILYWAGTTIIGAMILGIIAYFIRE